MILLGFATTFRTPLTALTAPATKFLSLLKRGPFTTTSILLLAYASYLMTGPVSLSSDIISASLAAGLFAILITILILVVAHGSYLRRHLSLTVVPPTTQAVSTDSVRIVLITTPIRIIPGAILECEIDFSHGGVTRSILHIVGTSRSERRTHLDVHFSHRGSWDINGVRCTLRDIAGLARLSWYIPYQTAVTIAPPDTHESTLPLISSTQRPGDMVVDTVNRQGDPYDLKPYHPSDGIKKIVWKAFAKSGELLSRHPEASMTPEGLVTIFVLARSQDDDICSKAISYVRSLKELQLDVVVGCEGAHGRPLAHDPEACQELLIDSVWDADRSTFGDLCTDAQEILDYCSQVSSTLTIRRLLIFCSGSRVAAPYHSQQIIDFAEWLATQNIEPIFCISEPRIADNDSRATLATRLRDLIIAPTNSTEALPPTEGYQTFLTRCLHRKWEVYV